MIRWFPAQYAGTCNACNSRFKENALIASVDGAYVGQECCDGTGFPPLTRVMPPRTQASDRCDNCFIIHATGQTECE